MIRSILCTLVNRLYTLLLEIDQEACNRWLKPPQQQVWSAKNTAMVRGWIEDCARGHPEIASGHVDKASPERRKVPFVPRRILDLNPFLPRCRGCVTEPDHEEFGANDIALVDGASIIAESESSGNTFKYAALSYCWGTKAPRIKLDKETLPAKRQGIAFSNLPQCLQDAVIVTRSLGMRYLWIDALCIVQDDAIDWEEQSGEMYQLFNNAFVIIGAAASTAFDQGFLGCRSSSPDTIALDFRSNLDPRIAGKFCLSLIPSGQKHRGFRHDIKVSKWATRGWVWQERMLAKRVLLFGDTMIHLQCDHKHTQSEDGRGVLGQIRSPHKETLNGWTWASWISEYSEKELTRLSDRLPAVSGFAKMMVQNSGNGTKGSSEYLAGIWRDDWHRQLCWVRSEPDQSFDEMLAGLRDREPRTGPTWSWASRRGRVQWVGMFASRVPSKFEAQIEKCEVVRAGKDPMGQVIKDSYLRLSGFLCHAPLVPEAGHRLRRQIERQQDPSNAPHEWQLDWTLSEYEIEYTPDWSLESEGGKEKDRKQEIRLFIVYTEEVFMMGKHRGLLLVDNGKGQFYRVGSFSLGHLGAGPPGEYGYGEWTRESIDIV